MIRKILASKPTTSEEAFLKWCSPAYVSNSILLRKSVGSGYGFYATDKISKGTDLLHIPSKLWKPFSAEHAVMKLHEKNPKFLSSIVDLSQIHLPNHTTQANHLVQSICLSLEIMSESARGISNPYINILKQSSFPLNPYAIPHPLVMSQELFLDPLLRGCKVYKDILLRRNTYDTFADILFGSGVGSDSSDISNRKGSVGELNVLKNEFKWAMGILLSRAISGNNYPFTLIPLWDFVNHSANSNNHNKDRGIIDTSGSVKTTSSSRVNASHLFDSNTGTFALVATEDIRENEEICITYGTHRDTASFMIMYGFSYNSVPKNNTDSISSNSSNSSSNGNINDTVQLVISQQTLQDITNFINKNNNNNNSNNNSNINSNNIIGSTSTNSSNQSDNNSNAIDINHVASSIMQSLAQYPIICNLPNLANSFKINKSKNDINFTFLLHNIIDHSYVTPTELIQYLDKQQEQEYSVTDDAFKNRRSDCIAHEQLINVATGILNSVIAANNSKNSAVNKQKISPQQEFYYITHIIDILLSNELNKYVTDEKLYAYEFYLQNNRTQLNNSSDSINSIGISTSNSNGYVSTVDDIKTEKTWQLAAEFIAHLEMLYFDSNSSHISSNDNTDSNGDKNSGVDIKTSVNITSDSSQNSSSNGGGNNNAVTKTGYDFWKQSCAVILAKEMRALVHLRNHNNYFRLKLRGVKL